MPLPRTYGTCNGDLGPANADNRYREPGISSDSYAVRESEGYPSMDYRGRRKGNDILSRGGSLVTCPSGPLLAGLLWDEDAQIIVKEADFADCGEASRSPAPAVFRGRRDVFKLAVDSPELDSSTT
jgi:hypothetical protein